MIWALPLLLSLSGADPRVELVELQLADKLDQALAATQESLVKDPAEARRLGLDYLRGHLLVELDRREEAGRAFADAMAARPELEPYARYRLAILQESLGHPEVAAGLAATLLGSRPPAALRSKATELLARSVVMGGDCRLLRRLDVVPLAAGDRRSLALTRAECAERAGETEEAVARLQSLLEDSTDDETALAAARRLARLAPDALQPKVALHLGLTFHRHREFGPAVDYLEIVLETLDPLDEQLRSQTFEAGYAFARSLFWQGRYRRAADAFGTLAARTDHPGEKARGLYQQGRCFELTGEWERASASFRRSYLAATDDEEWAAPALLAALRLEWRGGNETAAGELYELLRSRRQWRRFAARAALFLAASDIVRGETDRASPWLAQAEAAGGRAVSLEVAYWRGRLAELQRHWRTATDAYLSCLRDDLYHPLSRAAERRLAQRPLVAVATEVGLQRAASQRLADLRDAWLLLRQDRRGQGVRVAAEERLQADHRSRPFLRLHRVPVEEWPLWRQSLTRPEELLLAMGIWSEGAPAVISHFPLSQPSLAFTGSYHLGRAGQTRRSLYIAEILSQRVPDHLPVPLLPQEFRRLLFPFPQRPTFLREARARGIEPFLLTAIVREESRFDASALSAASARGLTQFVLPTARRLGVSLGFRNLDANDLYHPETAIALGSAYLAELASRFGNRTHLMVAAYNAGEDQAMLWRSYCYSQEMEEYFTKVGFRQTRAYLEKVLATKAQYEELWDEEWRVTSDE